MPEFLTLTTDVPGVGDKGARVPLAGAGWKPGQPGADAGRWAKLVEIGAAVVGPIEAVAVADPRPRRRSAPIAPSRGKE